MPKTGRESIWTRAFALLCLAEFLGYAQHFILQPTFPLYITHLGGSPFIVGLVIASFGVTSVISRPIIGYWADRWSVTGVMILGLFTQTFANLICLIPYSGATMLANGVRGIGWSGMNTGGYTLLTTAAPVDRRGEASGYYGGVQSTATIFFPAVALWIIDAPYGGFNAVFLVAMILVLTGAAAAYFLSREVAAHRPRRDVEASTTWWRQILNVFDRHILLAALLLFTLHLSLPSLSSFVVLYAKHIGIGQFGWYYVVIGITSTLARPLLGRLSDKIGCGQSLLLAFGFETAALLMMPMVKSLVDIMIAGAIWYLGSAIGGARILALAMECAPAERRGRAMASFSVAFPLSNGTGALLNGIVLDVAGYAWMYYTAAILCSIGFVLTAKNWSSLK
ncbi:MAG TPA: MFS transporter [Candidatus Binatia bacterium]